MADRLFSRGRTADAAAEYAALRGESSIAPDQLLYRLAECERALGHADAAAKSYAELAAKYPTSVHAGRARLMLALAATGDERLRRLKELDSDRVESSVRAAALYHYGSERSDLAALSRAIEADPKGRYADYARLQLGRLQSEQADAVTARKGMEAILSVAFGGGPLAEEALYLAAAASYRSRRYGEAGSLFRRYLKNYPHGGHSAECPRLMAWCDYLNGRYADAAATCGELAGDDFDYLRAAAASATGDRERALKLFGVYLENHPEGRYRAEAELAEARLEFESARASGDNVKLVESARRAARFSRQPADELRLGWAYETAERQEEAVAAYDRLVRAHAGSAEAAEALYRKALVEVRRENWAAAELALAEAVASGKLGATAASASFWRGVAAARLGHEQESVSFLKTALASELGIDESREARLILADVDWRAGRTEAAKAAYAKLVAEGACERMDSARLLAVGRLLGGAGAETCAKALIAGKSAEWRQAGWALLGDVEESRAAYTAAVDAYRKALAEPAKTAEARQAAYRLGRLETRQGQYARAEDSLRTAVELSVEDVRARAEAYLALAENAEAKGDAKSACAYATVVDSLFDDATLKASAQRILNAHPEATK